MLKVGLTGGIGCGKSAAVRYFLMLDVPVVDADAIAREVVQPDEPSLTAIVETFGVALLQSDGTLDRAMLRREVFTDASKLEQLESILHPAIRQRIEQKVLSYQDQAAYIVIDIPLLIEKGYVNYCDRIVVVDCMPEQQIERVMQRDHSSRELIEQIMARQVKREIRLQYATDILDNSSTLARLYQGIDQLHVKLLAMHKPLSDH